MPLATDDWIEPVTTDDWIGHQATDDWIGPLATDDWIEPLWEWFGGYWWPDRVAAQMSKTDPRPLCL